jgi:hypothetical protein
MIRVLCRCTYHVIIIAVLLVLPVRAFGILIAELVERIEVPRDKGDIAQTRLRKLASRATGERPTERPLFASVCAELAQIEAAESAGVRPR